MKKDNTNPNRSGLLLGAGVAIAALVTAGVFAATSKPREQTAKRVLSEQIDSLLPKGSYDSLMPPVELKAPASANTTITKIYAYKRGRSLLGRVLQATTTDGYSGEITFLVAITLTGVVQGVAILDHSETPGLGDKIESSRSNWLDQFTNLDASSLSETDWGVKKEGGKFDAITGATITPRAVVKAVGDVAKWHLQNNTVAH